MTEQQITETSFQNRRRNIFVRTFYFLFSWRTIILPWRKIPAIWRWCWDAPDWKHRVANFTSIPIICALVALLVGPLLTGYPFVWVGTYVYNYTSVIYPKDIPNAMPKETPQQLAEYKENQGTAVVKTLIATGEEMLTNWQDNDLWFSSSQSGIFGVDNPRNLQIGELQMFRFILQDMRATYTRNGANDAFNPLIVNAYNSFAFTSDSWAFPRTEGVYQEGVDSLKLFLADVEKGKAHIYPTTYNASEMLKTIASALAGSARSLEAFEKTKIPLISPDESAGFVVGGNTLAMSVSWLHMDDSYFQAQGNLRVAYDVIKALRIDVRKAGQPKGADEYFARVIRQIEQNTDYLADPMVVVPKNFFTPSNGKPLALALQSASKDILVLVQQLTN